MKNGQWGRLGCSTSVPRAGVTERSVGQGRRASWRCSGWRGCGRGVVHGGASGRLGVPGRAARPVGFCSAGRRAWVRAGSRDTVSGRGRGWCGWRGAASGGRCGCGEAVGARRLGE
jgi:hypothetical protein